MARTGPMSREVLRVLYQRPVHRADNPGTLVPSASRGVAS